MIRQKILALGFGALVSLTAGAAAQAQEATPPNTSVRNLEAPIDVRRKQLHGHSMMRHHHAMMTYRHRLAHRGLGASATIEHH